MRPSPNEITRMRPLTSFINDNPWTSLVATPVLLTIVPQAVLWWWPGVAPQWASLIAGTIGVLANLIVALLIGLARRYFSSRNPAPTFVGPDHASDDKTTSPNRRPVMQTINSGSGIAALLTGLCVVLFLFVPQVWDWLIDADDSNKASEQAGMDPKISSPAITPTVTTTLFPLPVYSLSSDELITTARSARTTKGRDAASFKAAQILVNRDEYDKAIEAASASAGYEGESEALTFVSRSAADDGKFTIALDAAKEINHSSIQDNVELEILDAIKAAALQSSFSKEILSYEQATQLPSFPRMLKSATSGGTYQGEDSLLFKIAEIEVIQHRYGNAIEAASKINSVDTQSEALTFVARCAIQEGLFNHAEQAAKEVDSAADKANLTVEVLTAVMAAETENFSPIIDVPSTSCR